MRFQPKVVISIFLSVSAPPREVEKKIHYAAMPSMVTEKVEEIVSKPPRILVPNEVCVALIKCHGSHDQDKRGFGDFLMDFDRMSSYNFIFIELIMTSFFVRPIP